MAGHATASAVSSPVVSPPVAATPELRRPPRSLWSDAWRQFRGHRLAVIGMVTLGLLLLATLVGPVLWRVSPDALDYTAGLQGPSLQHPFGTDDLGRDLFARALYGGRVSMAVGVVAMLIAVTLGTLVGAVAGFSGGWSTAC